MSRRDERGAVVLDGTAREATDVVVLGSGVAGLSAALALAPRRVLLVTKSDLGGGASRWAQGGVAAALGPGDRPELHARDTLGAGAGLCDPEVVAAVTSEGPARIDRLLELGARFDRDPSGRLRFGREGAHGRRRVLHADGDATGAELVRVLVEAVRAAPHVRVLEHTFAEDFLLDGDRLHGVRLRPGDLDQPAIDLSCRALVLATGGLGQLFLHTTNPCEATGDGLAMAARAGAVLADLEMVQFHPTALAVASDPLPLVTEALRGEGAVLRDEAGRRFMVDVDPRAELAPRDIVAREIWNLARIGETAHLDTAEAVGDSFPKRFPTVWASCRRHGIDPRRESIPITPAAHYAMAGVATDALGRTSIPGLWACGEVASSGLHGANRLASNSLLEGLVLGARVGADILACGDDVVACGDRELPGIETFSPESTLAEGGRLAAPAEVGGVLLPAVRAASHWDGPRAEQEAAGEAGGFLAFFRSEIRHSMWQEVGLVRNEAGLRRSLKRFHELSCSAPARGEVANLALLARLVTAAALERRESRGAHFRSDYLETDPAWQRRLFWTVDSAAETSVLIPAADPFADSFLAESTAAVGQRAIA